MMPTSIEDRIAVSTWSLHRLLGTTYPHDLATTAIGPRKETYGEGKETLLDLPAVLVNHGYHRMELVSFHLPSRDPVYLGELHGQLKSEGVVLQTLLIDDGDISHPEHGARDTAWIASWIEIANQLGAENARIIAGKQKPTPETLDRSAKALASLVKVLDEKRRVAVCRELTKIHESVIRGSAQEVENHFKLHADQVRGEVVIIVGS